MLEEKAGKKGVEYDFFIEESCSYSFDTHTEFYCKKSLYEPFYVLKNKDTGKINRLEASFIQYLDNSKNVEWFWQNGTELMRINFGIPYNNGLNTFQPDFIVKFSNGNVGIFDTKPIGYREEDAKVKAKSLYEYIFTKNKERTKNLIVGGIVISHNNQFYVYNESEYKDFESDNTKWTNFNEFLHKNL